MPSDQTTPWDGLPLHPERDGWHWLVPAINPTLPPGAYRWHAPPRADVVGQWDAGHPLDVVRRGYAYAGPCVMPDEAARLRAEVASLRLTLGGRTFGPGVPEPIGCPAPGACAQVAEIGRLRSIIRVNGLRAGASHTEIDEVIYGKR